jgi:molybdenum cofactor biosynthesis enzyme MoaA
MKKQMVIPMALLGVFVIALVKAPAQQPQTVPVGVEGADPNVTLGAPRTHGTLTIYPLVASRIVTTVAYMSLDEVKTRLAQRYELLPGVSHGGGPARYVQVAGTELRIGFITPISQHFCEPCNRVRLAVDGTLYMCLGQDDKYELRPLLRDGIDDAGLKQHIRDAIALKPERHEFRDRPDKIVRFMSQTGG